MIIGLLFFSLCFSSSFDKRMHSTNFDLILNPNGDGSTAYVAYIEDDTGYFMIYNGYPPSDTQDHFQLVDSGCTSDCSMMMTDHDAPTLYGCSTGNGTYTICGGEDNDLNLYFTMTGTCTAQTDLSESNVGATSNFNVSDGSSLLYPFVESTNNGAYVYLATNQSLPNVTYFSSFGSTYNGASCDNPPPNKVAT